MKLSRLILSASLFAFMFAACGTETVKEEPLITLHSCDSADLTNSVNDYPLNYYDPFFIDMATEYLTQFPESVCMLYSIGTYYYINNDLEQAFDYFMASAQGECYFKEAPAYRMLSVNSVAYFYINQQEYEKGFEYATLAVDMLENITLDNDPVYMSMPYYNLGLCSFLLGDFDTALYAFDNAFALAPQEATYNDWNFYQAIYLRDDPAQSLILLEEMETYYPMHPGVYFSRYFNYYSTGDYVNAYEEAAIGFLIARNNDYMKEEFIKIMSEELVGSEDITAEEINYITNLNDALILSMNDNTLIESTELLLSALEYNPDSDFARLTLAQNYYFLGRYEESRDAYMEFISSRPYYQWAYYEIGLVFEELGDTESMNISAQNYFNIQSFVPENGYSDFEVEFFMYTGGTEEE